MWAQSGPSRRLRACSWWPTLAQGQFSVRSQLQCVGRERAQIQLEEISGALGAGLLARLMFWLGRLGWQFVVGLFSLSACLSAVWVGFAWRHTAEGGLRCSQKRAGTARQRMHGSWRLVRDEKDNLGMGWLAGVLACVRVR